MSFIEQLEYLMKKQNVTSKYLSETLGIGKNSIKYWKDNGNIPNGEILKSLSNFFGVSVDYLLGKSEIPHAASSSMDSNSVIAFCDRLKQLIINKGLLRSEFIEDFGLSPDIFDCWDKGENSPDLALLNRLSEYFDVSIDYLLGKTNIKRASSDTEEGTLIGLNGPKMNHVFLNGDLTVSLSVIAERMDRNRLSDLLDIAKCVEIINEDDVKLIVSMAKKLIK